MNANFCDVTIEDKQWVQKILCSEGNINSESAFGTSFLWARPLDIKISRHGNVLFKKTGNSYEFPRGCVSQEELKECVFELEKDAKKHQTRFKFTELLDCEKEKLEKIFSKKFQFIPKREKFEYMYCAKDLATLGGKKYHSKRNHIARFKKDFSWYCEPIKKSNLDECEAFFENFFKNEKQYVTQEYLAIKAALQNFEALSLVGMIIKVGEKPVACTIGEKINSKAFVVHFEKALPQYRLAYSVINNEFAKSVSEQCELINREEDMGLLGLRKSKLSYKPTFLLKKYDAFCEDLKNDCF